MAAASKVVPSDSATVSLRGMVTWTLRGHWKLWYPWVLVVTQAIFIVVLLVTLERESVRPVISTCKSMTSPTMPPASQIKQLVDSKSVGKSSSHCYPYFPAIDRLYMYLQLTGFNHMTKLLRVVFLSSG